MSAAGLYLRELHEAASIAGAHALMMQLRPHQSDAERFVAQVLRQRQAGYGLLAALRDGRIVGLAGVRPLENLLYGRFLYVDDLVVDADERGGGVGAALLEAAMQRARQDAMDHLVLDTAAHNLGAQAFYERHGLSRRGVHYSVSLQGRDG